MAAMKVAKLPVPLTASEKNIFDFLLRVNERFNLGVTLRVAGGWVRDRMLGGTSDDIDIAIEGLTPDGGPVTGAVFAEYVSKLRVELGMEQRTVAVIKSNPDQSKHLETATTTIFGESIDLVNLRSEEYTDTRIPEIKPGTPVQDAERRDLTINALFYNLHTEDVEDFTTGLEDLEKRLVRTPLCPSVTFHDDPLRLLRCVRFACRFGCRIHDDIVNVAQQPSVHAALRDKVSRERVGIEIRKTLMGPDPSRCFKCFQDFKVEDCLFKVCKCDKKGNVTQVSSVVYSKEEWDLGTFYSRELQRVVEEGVFKKAAGNAGLLTTGEDGALADAAESALGVALPPVLAKERSVELHLAAFFAAWKPLPQNPGELDRFLSGVVTHGLKLSKKSTEIVHVILTGTRLLEGVWKAIPCAIASAASREESLAAFFALFDAASDEQLGVPVAPSRRVLLCEAYQATRVESEDKKSKSAAYHWKEALALSELMACASIDKSYALCEAVEDPSLTSPSLVNLRKALGIAPVLKGNELAVCMTGSLFC